MRFVGRRIINAPTNSKDKTTIAKLLTDLSVSEEKLKQFQNKESEFRQLQQLYIETKTKNAELQTRMNEQVKNAEEKLALLKDAEGRVIALKILSKLASTQSVLLCWMMASIY